MTPERADVAGEVPAPKGPVLMELVVTFTDNQGKRQGVEFAVNVPLP